jgi:hypothetical protein
MPYETSIVHLFFAIDADRLFVSAFTCYNIFFHAAGSRQFFAVFFRFYSLVRFRWQNPIGS